jgi:hypothetical protein
MNIVNRLLNERKEFLENRLKINDDVIERNKRWKEENNKELEEIKIAIEVIKNVK